MGFRRPSASASSGPAPLPPVPQAPPPAFSPRGPSYTSGSSFNPFSTPFQYFNRNPFLTSFGRRKAGRPSLIAQRER